ncbi:MAG: twin transmembrane helix small protein [Acidiferrobacteraceae bacterium]
MLLIHVIIIAVLAAILTSLFSALVFMFRGRGRDTRMVRALTIRIVLSLSLFLFLMIAFYFGLIPGYAPS